MRNVEQNIVIRKNGNVLKNKPIFLEPFIIIEFFVGKLLEFDFFFRKFLPIDELRLS